MTARRIISSLLFAASLAGTQAQRTSPYTDPATGIAFQQISQDGFSFGIALPEQPGADFIGQISAATTAGWAGASLKGPMLNSLLVVAWPNDQNIISSLRVASGYSNPSVFSGGASLKLIAAGTSVNSTGFTYTFLCEGCILTDGTAFNVSADSTVMGWAMSTTAVGTPSSSSSALNYHSAGFGNFGVDLAGAKSADFASWAAMAGNGNTTVPNPGNGTTPIPGNNDTVPISNSTYDYIVVGGGASGIVVAQRLVETGKAVLLLERGGPSFYSSGGDLVVPWNDTTTAYEVPGLFNWLSSFSGNDAYCSDTAQIAGCILGGGTTVNGMAFIRPPSFDFDDSWPAGWKWSDVESSAARFYARNPGTTAPSMDGKYYDNSVYDVLSKWFSGAGWKKADTNDEPDEKFQIYSYPAINVANGRRSGPVSTYLPLAMSQSNFKLQLHTKVIRAVRTNSTITGVEVEDQQGQRMLINVNQGGKVILAAGAMSSPRLLFNSGIGLADQINTVKAGTTGVTLPPESSWINLPVGFIRDHAIIDLSFNVTGGMAILGADAFQNPSQENIELFRQSSGPLTQSFMRMNTFTTVTTSDNHKVLVQMHCYARANDTIRLMFILTHGSTSTGTLGITPDGNTEFTDPPYLKSSTDKEAMALAIDEILAISRRANSTLKYTGSANDTGASIVANTKPMPGVHMTGTTIMGTDDGRNNGSAVVDTNCKVYGTDNLFVVDAGMHADLPTGNTQAIVMVAAEHAVQKIIALGGGNGTTVGTGKTSVEGSVPDIATDMPYRGRPVRGEQRGRWWQL